jgi:hypothetical protein
VQSDETRDYPYTNQAIDINTLRAKSDTALDLEGKTRHRVIKINQT